tara:strand:- start:2424 stop:3062 length:639 start_codon:yes stop_codon:yes gene_type:complete
MPDTKMLNKEPIFIHIPKAGGKSMESFFKKINPRLRVGCLHMKASTWVDQKKNSKKCFALSEKERESAFIFSFVRNPFDRLLSAHAYLSRGYGNENDIKFGKTLNSSFRGFIKKDFLSFWKGEEFITGTGRLHFEPMINFINRDIDFIGRFENLQKDFNTVCDTIGVERKKLPHKNSTKHKHYTEYYDDETREIVSKIYAKDIEYFGYKFGE